VNGTEENNSVTLNFTIMKTITSSIFLMLLLASCSSDDEIVNEPVGHNKQIFKKSAAVEADNPANAYDGTGQIYRSLLDQYYAVAPGAQNIEDIISAAEGIAFMDSNFLELQEIEGYTPLSASVVVPYLSAASQDIAVLLDPRYGAKAVEAFENLVLELELLQQNDASLNDVYNAIRAIESSIMAESTITENERSAFLCSTSILRNALYHQGKRKRRDRDWEWMVGNIAATANYALKSQPEAITMGITTDVYLN
jgi:hypothetical protein